MTLHPGDIVEIETPGGLAYVQVTHNHPAYSEVVRALPGLHDSRPGDLAQLAGAESSFSAMVPLGGAIETQRIKAERIGSAEIPPRHKPFPTFRMAVRDRKGDVAYWWLWDGEGLRYETELDEEAQSYPLREVMTADTFVAKLG